MTRLPPLGGSAARAAEPATTDPMVIRIATTRRNCRSAGPIVLPPGWLGTRHSGGRERATELPRADATASRPRRSRGPPRAVYSGRAVTVASVSMRLERPAARGVTAGRRSVLAPLRYLREVDCGIRPIAAEALCRSTEHAAESWVGGAGMRACDATRATTIA